MTTYDTRHNGRSWAKVTVRYFPHDLDENNQVQASEASTITVAIHGEGSAAVRDAKLRAVASVAQRKEWDRSAGYATATRVEILDYHAWAREVGIDSQVECINNDGEVS